MMLGFQRFVAIDWSGARTPAAYRGKIQLAQCTPGDAAPALLMPSDGTPFWTRAAVADWIAETATEGPPTLIGMDFSFAPPFIDVGAYLPGDTTASTAQDFWAFVDGACDDTDLGAASFVEQTQRRHFYLGKADGEKAPYMRLRACERAYNAGGGRKPSSVFDAIGAAQVAKASFAGMRLLHRLKGRIAIWPIDAPHGNVGSLLVEIYCQAFIRHAGLPGRKIRDLGTLNAALANLGSLPVHSDDPLSDDQTDVIVTAAGLRLLSQQPRYFAPAALTAEIARTEGWTYGVA